MKHSDMHQSIERKVIDYIDIFNEKFEGKTGCVISYPVVDFCDTHTMAALCEYRAEKDTLYGNIKFHSKCIPLNYQRYIDYIVGHEVAHWCVALAFGHKMDEDNENHTGAWLEMMKFLGCPPVDYLNPFICHPIKGMHQWKCDCSVINLDDEENEEACKFGCECENCGQDYKPLNKGEKMK